MPSEFLKAYEIDEKEGDWYIKIPMIRCPERECEYDERSYEQKHKCFFDMRRYCNKEYCPLKVRE